MSEPTDNELRELEDFKQGRLGIETLRSLPTKLGRSNFQPGIPTVIELLTHEDEIVRYNAIMALTFKYGYKPAVDDIKRSLAEDPDPDCRDAAVGGLASLFRGSRDCTVLSALGKACLADSDEDVCRSAYKALLIVNSDSEEEYLKILRGPRLTVDSVKVSAILEGCRDR